METIDDFIQKYRNAFVFIDHKKDKVLAEFVDCDEDRLYFQSEDLGKIQLKFDGAMKNITTKFPTKGLYNTGNYLFSFFYRKPERQFKRAPSSNNSTLIQIGVNELQPINFDTLSECFNPTYHKSKAINKLMLAKRGGIALSPTFGITIAGQGYLDLWYYNNIIGTIDPNDKITVGYEPLRQEVIDFFGKDLVWN